MRLSALRSFTLTALVATSACTALLDTEALNVEGVGDGGARDRGLRDGRARDAGVGGDRGVVADAGRDGAVPRAQLTLTAPSGAVLTEMNVTGPALTGTAIIFTLRNSGTAATAGVPAPTLSNGANFEVVANNCAAALAAGASCTLSVRPKATANGPYNSTLRVVSSTVSSNALTLGGTASGIVAAPVLNLSAATGATLDQMDVASPGPTGDAIIFTVRNTGSTAMASAVAIELGSPTHFLVEDNTCTTALADGATCTFSVRPTAAANASYESGLEVRVGTQVSNALNLSGTASGFAPALTLTPGTAQTGMNVTPAANPGAAVSFTVENTGTAPTAVIPTVVRAPVANFDVVNNTCTAVLVVGATCTFDLKPKATVNQLLDGTVEVTAGSGIRTASVKLGGTASGFAALSLAMTPATRTGMDVSGPATTGTAVTFTVVNNDPTTTAVAVAVAIVGNTASAFRVVDSATDCIGADLAPAATCTFQVEPTASANEALSATMTVGDATLGSNTVTLEGSASGF
ncbi:MAG: choice-of-anchor D domain-containing protein [Proteobacteria bacterium]|nr:choice-of-anchor D domain-containing protein [Pseudomonadota bacterium]